MTPLQFTTTSAAAVLHGVKMCVHGRAGSGKTTLISTLPAPLILSAESGLLSLRHLSIPTIVIHSLQEMEEAHNFITGSAHAAAFQSIALDSISEIAEVCLGEEKQLTKDGRKAYGEMNEKMAKLIRKYRDLSGKHVYFSAKQGAFTDEVLNVTRYGPDMPGKQLTKDMPYYFDEVYSLEIGRTPDGRDFRFLRTQTDFQIEAKDRSGALAQFEEPHLGKIIDKILAAVPNQP